MQTTPELADALREIVAQIDRVHREHWKDHELRALLVCVQYVAGEALAGAEIQVEISQVGPELAERVFVVRSSIAGVTLFSSWPQSSAPPARDC